MNKTRDQNKTVGKAEIHYIYINRNRQIQDNTIVTIISKLIYSFYNKKRKNYFLQKNFHIKIFEFTKRNEFI